MEDFKKELKRLGDIEFAKLKTKYSGKVDRKKTISSMSNNLGIYGKVIEEFTKGLEKIGNEIYPKMGVSDKDAQITFNDVLKSYLPKIGKLLIRA